MMRRWLRRALTIIGVVILGACAGLPGQEPVQVTVADIESLPGEGLELRMLVKLRVQNPNDAAIEYDGVSLRLEVQGKTFASVVSDERGTVPRFGEAIVSVPVTASTLRLVMNAIGIVEGGAPDKIDYRMDGRLNGPAFGSTRFQAQGQFALPGSTSAPARQ